MKYSIQNTLNVLTIGFLMAMTTFNAANATNSLDQPLDPQPQPSSRFEWKPKLGVHIGMTEYSTSTNRPIWSLFLENQLSKHFAARLGLESAGSHRNFYRDDFGPGIPYKNKATFKHVGLALDFIYYLRAKKTTARGLYVLGGAGYYYSDVSYPSYYDDHSESHSGSAIAWGFGWTGKYIGIEYKHTMPSFNTRIFPVGTEYRTLSLSCRFAL
jgi:hypothetical protein